MKDETRNRLLSILEDKKRTAIDKENMFAKLRKEQELFMDKFQQVCGELINPKMLEFEEVLNANGYGSYINSTNEDLTLNGFKSKCSISLEVSRNVVEDFQSNDTFPHVMFIANKHNFDIIIHESTIFPSGAGRAFMKNRSYTLDQITEDVIEQEISESIEKILRKER